MISISEKGINFKIDAQLYKQLKIKVIENDTTIKSYIIELIKNDLKIEQK